ncbi:MAG: undecaprenyl-diphosphate phosphatase [Spirochaetales bacterium]|jgi:undecaprenyl-diphosphatase|nr:undecaprenyl-diphosphate phosphatase [Spirochaetales bacterium]
MSILQALLLGLIQGITEFLPVSSSGHLVMARYIFEIEQIPQLFDILLHLSTLVAVILVFRARFLAIIVSLIRFAHRRSEESDKANLRFLLLIIIATLCTGVIGAGLSLLDAESYPKLVSVLFIITGAILIATKFLRNNESIAELKPRHAIITGLAQGIGVLPGISRSGITISASLMSGVSREQAGEFSFLIAFPAIVGAALLDIKQTGDLMNAVSSASLAVGMCAAFLSGLICLILLIRLIRGGKLYLFSIYLIPLGIVSLVLL